MPDKINSSAEQKLNYITNLQQELLSNPGLNRDAQQSVEFNQIQTKSPINNIPPAQSPISSIPLPSIETKPLEQQESILSPELVSNIQKDIAAYGTPQELLDDLSKKQTVKRLGDENIAMSIASQLPESLVPHYDQYEGSAWDDFKSATYNMGALSTAKGLSYLIPSIAKQGGAGEWADNWIKETDKWADRNEMYVSQMGQKSFFDTGDIRSLSAGLGQGIGSLIPMLTAAAVGSVTGGAGALAFGASSLTALPSIVDSGIESGLSVQHATALGLTLAPMIGLLEKAGMDGAVQAGLKPALGRIEKSILKSSLSKIAKSGLTGEQFGSGTLKVALGELSELYAKDLTKKGIGSGLLKEVGVRTADLGLRAVGGASAEAGTEFLQSYLESAGKHIYDNYYANKDAEVREGKFGVDVTSYDTFKQALEEGFYGGLIGGSFSMTARGAKGLRANTITQALDIAKSRGKLDEEVKKMKDVVSSLSNPDEDKNELNTIIDSASEMVSKTNLSDVTNATARHQIFSLGHFAKTLRGEIEQTAIEGVLPKELEDLNALKVVRQQQRLQEVGRAIKDINEKNDVVDLNNYRIFDILKELPPASQETIQAEEKKKGIFESVKETFGKGVEAVKNIFETKEEPVINKEEEVKDAIAEQRRLRDEEITQIQAIRTDLGSDAELFDDMPDIVDKTIDRIDLNIPVDPVQIEESLTALDNQFVKLREYRNSKNRTHTTEQIDSVIDLLDETKTEIQNFQLKQVNYEKQNKPTQAKRESEVTPTEKVTGEKGTTEKVTNAKIDLKESLTYAKGNKIGDERVAFRIVVNGNEIGNVALAKKDKNYYVHSIEINENSKGKGIAGETYKIIAEKLSNEGYGFTSARESTMEPEAIRVWEKLVNSGLAVKNKDNSFTYKQQLTTTDAKTFNETEFNDKAEKIKEIYTDWKHALNSLNKRNRQLGIKEVPVTKEEFLNTPYGLLEDVSKTSESSQRYQAEKVEGEVKAEPIISPVEEIVASDEKPTFDLLNDILNLKDTLSAEEKAQIDEEMANNPMFKAIFGNKKKHQLQSEQAKITSDPVLFNQILNELKRMYPYIPVEVLDTLLTDEGVMALGALTSEGVKINKNEARQDSILHEFAHVFTPLIKNSALYKSGLELIKDTKYYSDAKLNYPSYTEEQLLDEALTQLVGETSLDSIKTKLNGTLIEKVLQWLKFFWNKIKALTGFAKAEDVANVIGMKLAYNKFPTSDASLLVGRKEFQVSFEKDKEHSIIRNSFIETALAHGKMKSALKGNQKHLLGVFVQVLDNNSQRSFPKISPQEFIKRNEAVVLNYLKLLNGLTADYVYNDSYYDNLSMDEKEKFIEESFSVVEKDDIDANVRKILDLATDYEGNPIDPNHIYGIVSKINNNIKSNKSFLDKLKERAELGAANINKTVAKSLYNFLNSLPEKLSVPVIEQLKNIKKVNFIRVTTTPKDFFIKESFKNKTSYGIKKKILDNFITRKDLAESQEGSYRYHRKNAINDIKNQKAIIKSILSNKQENRQALFQAVKNLESSISKLIGIKITPDMFVTGNIDKTNIQKSKENGLDAYLLFADALLSNDYAKIRQASNIASRNIANSVSDSSMFKNVEGNIQRAYRMPGLVHKFFTDTFNDEKLANATLQLPMFKKLKSIKLGELYKKHFTKLNEQMLPIISHTDGFQYLSIDKSISKTLSQLNQDDEAFYHFSNFFNGFITGDSYNQSMGVLGARDFQVLINVPILKDNKQSAELLNEITANYNPQLLGKIIPSIEQLKKDREYLFNVYNSLPQEIRNSIDKAINNAKEEGIINKNETVINIIGTFILNDAIHRLHTSQYVTGDVNNIQADKNGKLKVDEREKRGAGMTSPIPSLYLGKKKAKIFVVKDIANGASNSQSFCNDFVADKIQQSGGALIDYKNFFKPRLNEIVNGDLIDIKTTTMAFKGRTQEDIEGQDMVKAMVNQAMQNLSKNNPDTPIFIVFDSAIKSKYPDTIYELEDLIENSNDKNLAASYEFVPKNFGVQFNINKDVSNDDERTSISTQLLKIAPHAPSYVKRVESKLARITDLKQVSALKYLSDKTKVIDDVERVGRLNGKTLGNRILEIIKKQTLNGIDKVDHYDIYHKLQSYISSVFTKTTKYKMPGAKLSQSVVYDGSLKWMEFGNEKIKPATVKVPKGFAEIGDQVICSRIPNSDFMTNIIATVGGFTEEGNNVIEVSPEWIYQSNADNDGDTLFTMKKHKNPVGEIEQLENQVFDDLWDMMSDAKVKDRYQQELDVADLKKQIDETNKTTGYNSVFSHIGGLLGMVQKSAALKESDKLIGALATGGKVNDVLSLADVSLIKPIKVFAKQATQFVTTAKKDAAEFLQLALDNSKEVRMHETGIIKENVGIVNMMLGLGYNATEIMEFLKSEPIRFITQQYLNNRKVFIKDRIDIQAVSKYKFQNNKTLFNGTTYNDIIEQYWNLNQVSLNLAPLSSIVQLDAKMPSNLVDLNKILNNFSKLEKSNFNNINNVLNRPLIVKYKEILLKLKEIYNDYSNINDDSKEFTNTLNSLEIDTEQKANVVSKTATAYIAQMTSNLKFKNRDAAMYYFNQFITKLNEQVNPFAIYESLQDDTPEDEFTIDDAQDFVPTWFRFVNINPDDMSIVPNKAIETEAGLIIDKETIEEEFKNLPLDIQNNLIEYSIYTNGLMRNNNSIADLLPDSVFENYINASKNFEMNEDFYDAIAIDNINSIKKLESPGIYGINDNENRQSIRLSNKTNAKYFKVEDNKKVFRIYKVDGETQVANLIHESKENQAVLKIKKTFTPFNIEKEGVTETSEVGTFNVIGRKSTVFTAKENVQITNANALFNNINNSSGNIKGNNLQEQVSDKVSEGIKGLKRTLRRLSSKFGIQYEIINDPNQKFAGAYDRKNNKVIINEAYVKSDTPFHEFAHPFLNSIQENNPELYNALINEINSSEEGKAVLEGVKERYPNLTKEEQEMEAIVELLGQLADNKIKSETLIDKLKRILVEIANTIKSLFGNVNNIIPSEINPNMTIADLANMVISDSQINLDKQNDVKAKNILLKNLDKIKEIINPNFEVLKLNDLLTTEQKSVVSKLTNLGFISNNGVLIRGKEFKNEKPSLGFRVPSNLKNWFELLKTEYPKASLIGKKYSPYGNFKKYEIGLGNNETISVFVPIDDLSGTLNESGTMNIQYQVTNSSNTTKSNLNSNSNVFNGHAFDTNKHQVSDVPTSVGYDKIKKRLQIEFKARLNLFNVKSINELDAETQKTIESNMASYITELIDRTQARYNNLKGDRQWGDLTGFVNLELIGNEIKTELANLLLEKQSVASDETLTQFKRFLDAYSVVNYLYENKETYLHRDGNKVVGVNGESINNEIQEIVEQEKNKRSQYFNKFPALGKTFRKIISSTIGKTYLYGSLLPKVFTKIINGKEDGFFNSLVYKAFKDGEENHFMYQEKLHNIIRNIFPDKSKMSEELSSISTIMGLDEDKLKTFKVNLNAKGFNIPVGRAIGLYKMLYQDHVQKNYVKYDKNGKKYFTINFGKIDLKSEGNKDMLQANEEYNLSNEDWLIFKNEFEKSDYFKFVDGLSKVFQESGKMITPIVETHIGIGLEISTDYYPISTGKSSVVSEKLETKRIEDFRFLKQRSDNAGGSLRIEDAFETTEFFIRESSNYYAYAIPVNNMRKLISSMQDKPEYEDIIKYLMQVNTDIQDYSLLGGVVDNDLNKAIQKFMNNFQVAVLGLNPSVAVKQSISIAPAAIHFGNVIFDSKYVKVGLQIAKGVTNVKFGKDWNVGKLDLTNPLLIEASELSPMLRQRIKGYLDREQGELRHHEMNPYSDEGKKKKFAGIEVDPTKFMEWIKVMDIATVMMIYARAKDEVNEKYPNETAEKKKQLLKERFEQVTTDTQPTYGIIERTPLGRSKNLLVRLFTLFGSQRSKNANMLIEAYNEYVTDPEDEQAKKKLKATLIMVGGVNSVGISVIDKIKYALMGNDDDEDMILDTAKLSFVNLMGNFYGAGEISGAVLTGKPWYKVNHPIYGTYNLASESLTNISDGKFVKGLDQAATIALQTTGIPTYPYKNLVSKPIKAIIE